MIVPIKNVIVVYQFTIGPKMIENTRQKIEQNKYSYLRNVIAPFLFSFHFLINIYFNFLCFITSDIFSPISRRVSIFYSYIPDSYNLESIVCT